MELLAEAALYVIFCVIFVGVSIGVFALLRVKHPTERDEGLLWSEAERITVWVLALVSIGGLFFFVLRYS